MHRSLVIPEIVGAVFEYLDPTRTEDALVETQALAALARTCTGFHDIALDVLWRHQTEIHNLIRCMPADLWETTEGTNVFGNPLRTLRPTRATIPSDWDRLQRYSYRIKSLTSANDPGSRYIEVNMLEVLVFLRHSAPPGYLLPNLTELTWNHARRDTFPFIDLFLGPHITSLVVEDCATDALSILKRNHSDLTVLRLPPGHSHPSRDINERSALVRSLTQVQWVDVGNLDLAAFMHLSGLESLDTLDVVLQPSLFFPATLTSTLFSHLESTTIQVDGVSLRALLSFMRSWNSPRLYSFDVALEFCPTPAEVDELYVTLASHCSHESLETVSAQYDFPDPDLGDISQFVNHGNGLRPLFNFHRLHTVRIHSAAGFDFDDALLGDMARAWPNITHLSFDCDTQACAPRGTLAALRAFATHCPHLSGLVLTLDATAIPPPVAATEVVVRHPALLTWSASESPITNAFDVARFLSEIFRNLEDVSGENRDLWREVRRSLPESR
ncbi:hypothetical protein C8R46DRAFT_1139540 [Mycena filopes]|nr:hypothetical protein C8R46DRAFT_1139540 [Mycena filopes]